MHIVSCAAPYGAGGLGLHLRNVVEDLGREPEISGICYCTGFRSAKPTMRTHTVDLSPLTKSRAFRLARFIPGLQAHWGNDAFDRNVASQITRHAGTITAFNGQALRTFTKASQYGCTNLHLECATAHARFTELRHAQALRSFPYEGAWLHPLQVSKTLREYESATTITVNSSYAYATMCEYGVSEQKLHIRRLRIDTNMFRPTTKANEIGKLTVLYVGSLTVTKGVPVLMEAFVRAGIPDSRLILCGGWSSHGMRRYIEAMLQRHHNIMRVSGDSLPYYHSAHIYVHPSFQDGFGYAPLEAAACGLPVVLTTDTGMSEALVPSDAAIVLRAGDISALVDALRKLSGSPSFRSTLGARARDAAVRWCASHKPTNVPLHLH